MFLISAELTTKVEFYLSSEVVPERVRLTVEYDGTNYFGWQYQGADKPTIQQTLEEALSELLGQKQRVVITGSGRTDKGVHAINQIAHFDSPKSLHNYDILRGFWPFLPKDIAVKKAEIVSPKFHAQRSATGKTYIYRILNREAPSALFTKRALWVRKPLDIDHLNAAAEILLGTHDFNCYRSEGSWVNGTERTLTQAKFIKSGEFVEFHITGSGFLKQMVRNIVGTLLEIELKGRKIESLQVLFDSKDRKMAGPTVEPQGLYLSKVFYPEAFANESFSSLDNTPQSL